MSPKDLVAWSHSLFKPSSGIKVGNIALPCMPGFNPGYELLTDAVVRRDVFLAFTRCNAPKYFTISCIQFLHALPLSRNYTQGVCRFFGFDTDKRHKSLQDIFDARRARDCEAKKPFVITVFGSSVFLNAPAIKPLLEHSKGFQVGVCKAKPDAALIFVYFNATFAIKEARSITVKCFIRPITHFFSPPLYRYPHHSMAGSVVPMAVPVVRWIGERIDAYQREVA